MNIHLKVLGVVTFSLFSCGKKDLDKSPVSKWFGQSCVSDDNPSPLDESERFEQPLGNIEHTSFANSTGLARIHERNMDGALIDQSLDLIGDGTLTNDLVFTVVTNGERVYNADNKFIYSDKSGEFDEVSLFANAVNTAAWFKENGLQSSIPKIAIVDHAVINGTSNNSIFSPASSSGTVSTIRVGTGDGLKLKNLSTDRDVIAHELAHAVIYERITATYDQSLVIHEGLADLFTMIRNDDPCLARSICVAGNQICVTNQCLRTADNNLVMDLAENNPIKKGQVISGMLWDLKKSGVYSQDELAHLVIRALNFMKESETYYGLILSLIGADKALFNGAHQDAITQAAKARKLIP